MSTRKTIFCASMSAICATVKLRMSTHANTVTRSFVSAALRLMCMPGSDTARNAGSRKHLTSPRESAILRRAASGPSNKTDYLSSKCRSMSQKDRMIWTIDKSVSKNKLRLWLVWWKLRRNIFSRQVTILENLGPAKKSQSFRRIRRNMKCTSSPNCSRNLIGKSSCTNLSICLIKKRRWEKSFCRIWVDTVLILALK